MSAAVQDGYKQLTYIPPFVDLSTRDLVCVLISISLHAAMHTASAPCPYPA